MTIRSLKTAVAVALGALALAGTQAGSAQAATVGGVSSGAVASFSTCRLCLAAMARLATQPAMTPPLACAAESKRHVKGRSRTPFAACVRGGALLLGVRSQRSTIRPRLR